MYVVPAVFGVTVILNYSCESTELDLRDDPNALAPEQASADFFISSIQEDFVRQFEGDADNDPNDAWVSGGNTDGDGFNEMAMELVRMQSYNGGAARNYASGYQGSDMNDEWDNAYRGI